ncbi:MAG: hypothetical protein M3037_13550 [Gemmatimonadota bacterium]|nr:hypothetical protein [Gemmatimonadota bacterium]
MPIGFASAQSGSAQWPLDSGSRVRIHSPIFSDNPQQGRVIRTQGDTLLFQPSPATASTTVSLHDITGLDVFQGTHSRKGKGALIGFLVGGGIAAAVTAATWKKTASFDFGRGGDAAFVGVPVGLLGAVVGMLIGAQETDTWVPVRLPNRN